jgi:glycosyltransferase involved in cell wall biosynthesis
VTRHDPVNWSLVVPMWNEAARIETTVAALAGAFRDRSVEVLFVDDGSTDGTADITERACKEERLDAEVIRLDANTGKGSAVRTGMLRASGDVVGFVDADLSAGPRQIELVFDAVGSDVDVALASRAVPTASITVRQPFLRRWSGWLFNVALRSVRLTRFTDTQCGLKAFRREVVGPLFEPLTAHGFAFDVEILARAERSGLRIVEVPVEWRHVDGSRLNPLRDGIRTAREAWRVRRVLSEDGRRACAPRR